MPGIITSSRIRSGSGFTCARVQRGGAGIGGAHGVLIAQKLSEHGEVLGHIVDNKHGRLRHRSKPSWSGRHVSLPPSTGHVPFPARAQGHDSAPRRVAHPRNPCPSGKTTHLQGVSAAPLWSTSNMARRSIPNAQSVDSRGEICARTKHESVANLQLPARFSSIGKSFTSVSEAPDSDRCNRVTLCLASPTTTTRGAEAPTPCRSLHAP